MHNGSLSSEGSPLGEVRGHFEAVADRVLDGDLLVSQTLTPSVAQNERKKNLFSLGL